MSNFSPIDWLIGMIIQRNPDDLPDPPRVVKQHKDRTGVVEFDLDGQRYKVTITRVKPKKVRMCEHCKKKPATKRVQEIVGRFDVALVDVCAKCAETIHNENSKFHN